MITKKFKHKTYQLEIFLKGVQNEENNQENISQVIIRFFEKKKNYAAY